MTLWLGTLALCLQEHYNRKWNHSRCESSSAEAHMLRFSCCPWARHSPIGLHVFIFSIFMTGHEVVLKTSKHDPSTERKWGAAKKFWFPLIQPHSFINFPSCVHRIFDAYLLIHQFCMHYSYHLFWWTQPETIHVHLHSGDWGMWVNSLYVPPTLKISKPNLVMSMLWDRKLTRATLRF